MNAPVRAVYGGQVPTEMQLEGELTVYWKGLPITFTTCDYDTDEIMASLKQKFCMGMPANTLPNSDNHGFQGLAGRCGGQGRQSMSKDM